MRARRKALRFPAFTSAAGNNTARTQAIDEQVAEVFEDEWSPPIVLLPEPSRHEVGYDYDLEDLPDGVTFNGLPAEAYSREYLETDWDPYCWCTECNLGRERDGLRGLLATTEAENVILRSENATLQARVHFLEALHGYR